MKYEKRCRSMVVLVAAVACLLADPVEGQNTRSCTIELRGGMRPASSDTVMNGNPFADMETGVAMAVGGSCPVAAGWRVGPDVESNAGPALWLVHLLATAERQVWEQGSVSAAVRGGVGWAFSTDGYGDSQLVLPSGSGARGIEPGVDGPLVSLGVRGMLRATGRVVILLDLGWRGSLLEETVFEQDSRREANLTHVFPVTLGLGLSL